MESIILLRAMAQKKGSIGNVMRIQCIRDTIEEYIFQYRDIFCKELVKNNAILYGADSMWLKKEHTIIENYNNCNIKLDEVYEIENYYRDMWYYSLHKIKSLDEHIQGMLNIKYHGQDLIDYNNLYNIDDANKRYNAFKEEYYADLEEEYRMQCDIDRAADIWNDR